MQVWPCIGPCDVCTSEKANANTVQYTLPQRIREKFTKLGDETGVMEGGVVLDDEPCAWVHRRGVLDHIRKGVDEVQETLDLGGRGTGAFEPVDYAHLCWPYVRMMCAQVAHAAEMRTWPCRQHARMVG